MSGVAVQIARLKRAYPKQPLDQGTIDVYKTELAEVPPGLLEEAVTVIIRTEEWFPTVAAIRSACAELALGLPSEADALAQIDARIAWAREPVGESPPVDTLVRQALTQVGGYAAFRAAEGGIARGQFARVYRELRAAAVREAQLAPALGPGPNRAIGR